LHSLLRRLCLIVNKHLSLSLSLSLLLLPSVRVFEC
jgi:hypothetical protein